MKSLTIKRRQAVLWILATAGSVSLSYAATPFETEGKFSVGNDGSANYSIPIAVPPGTAGMQPQLALNYNSNGGNGIVGMGWGIDGLSQISRCPTTLEQDGVINGVNYTSTDRFCLDGQRLIATTDTYNTSTKQYTTTSAYGANGTEYRTESANFAKIISYGQAGTGPASFKVWTKGGQIIEYGNTPDSGIEAQGKPTIRTWGVNKISDTKGNYIAVTYTEDNANGEAYVQKIDYTGNASSIPAVTPYANVQFVYEARPDITTGYQAGSVLKTTKRLTNIQTYNGTTQIKNYKLTYELSQSTNRSRLKTIQECDGNSVTPSCKQPITLQSEPIASASNYFARLHDEVGWGRGNGLSNGSAFPILIGDWNGDGKTDWGRVQAGEASFFVATGTGFTRITGVPGWGIYEGFTNDSDYPIVLGDWNGDGKTDWGRVHANGMTFFISTGAGFTEYANLQNWGRNSGLTDGSTFPIMLGDWNGDGKTDWGRVHANGITFFISTGSGFAQMTDIAGWGTNTGFTNDSDYPIVLGDWNGDGKTDWGRVHANGMTFFISTGTGFTEYANLQNWGRNSGFTNDSAFPILLGDWNGDGRTDWGRVYATGMMFFISTGSGFTQMTDMAGWGTNNGLTNDSDYPIVLGDWNGDGKTDWGRVHASGMMFFISTGSGFIAYSNLQDWGRNSGFTNDSAFPILLGDWNGDGRTDWGRVQGGETSFLVSTGTGFVRITGASGWGTYDGFTNDFDYPILLGDWNGDGKMDWGRVQAGAISFLYNPVYTFDHLNTISLNQNNVISIAYKPLTNNTLYAKGVIGELSTSGCAQPSGDNAISNGYPIQNLQEPMYVVSSNTNSDGIGGLVTTSYQYGGLKSHVRGRGSLGFRYIKESSPDSDLNVTTFYRQDFPFIGLPCQVEKRRLSDNALLNVVQSTYANSDLATSTMISNFPYLNQSVEQAYELDGSLVSTTTTTNQYDGYGNVTSVKVDDGLGNIKTTISTYNNNVGNWLLGRLIRSTVTSVTP
jgi:hypothetical protein